MFTKWSRGLVVWMLAASAGSAGAQVNDRSLVPGGGAGGLGDGRDAWVVLDQAPPEALLQAAWIRPEKGTVLGLSRVMMSALLANAPLEGAQPVSASQAVIALPRPDGGFERFAYVESSIMEPGLAVQVPQIRTYLGQGIDNPSATVRFDLTPLGFHAQVFTPAGDGMMAYYIDPMTVGDMDHYTSYWRADLRGLPLRQCGTPNVAIPAAPPAMTDRGGPAVTRRIIRTAVAATGEYTTFISPPGNVTAANGLAGIVTAINRVNQVYEIDLAARLVLVSNNLSIVYTDAGSDPYSGSLSDMQGQNQSNLDSVIGNGNYDLGHMFDQRVGGGNAGGIGSVCNNGNKGTGFTGAGAPTGDFFWIDYVAHEMGHQLGGTHTFNNCGDNGQRTGSTAYEPGSGISIMAYAGICGADDLATASPPTGASIPFFNFSSIDQIRGKINEGGTCLAGQATGNDSPQVVPIPGVVLPIRTPFRLNGITAMDSGGTAGLTNSWEQADLGPARALGADTGNGEALFRPFPPVAGLSRDFPKAVTQTGTSQSIGETLPLFARNSTFTFLVRDNVAGAGGVGRVNVSVQFVDSPGFRVTAPTDGQLECDQSVTVTWDVAGTNQSPINVSNVQILYSTNGGANLDYPVNLGTFANNGSANVTIPNTPTTMGRFMVRGVEQPFFALSGTFTTDVQPPDIVCPANITRGNDPGVCGAVVSFNPTVTDNCPGATIVCRVGAQAVTSPRFFEVGTTTVTCTATDGAGLTDQCSFTVTVNDVEPPVISAVDAVVELDDYGNATLTPATFSASATDNCLSAGCPVTLSLSQSVFLCPPVNVPIAVTVYGEDCHNNVGSRQVNVTFPDPDCNMNGQADICDILSGRSQDCDHNRVPDECQCVWDGGDAPKDINQVHSQISHVGGGSGPGAKVADDFYLAPGQMFRLFEFNGVMLTNLLPSLRKARVELYEDCDGRPAGAPIFSMQNTGVEELGGPDAEGFYLVKYIFNLCDERLWLEGGKSYWWSMYGLGSCDDGDDLSSWVVSDRPMMGAVPVKSDGLGGQVPPSCYPTLFDAWHGLDECCIGCVNMVYKLVGQSCPIIWDNGHALVGLGAGGVLSENISTSTKSRAADDFIIKPCVDQTVCLIDAWVWSNCNPVRGFVEIYEDDCGKPGALYTSLSHPKVISTDEVAVIDGVARAGYILRFDELMLILPAGRTYWLSAGGDRTGSFNARTYFAFGGRCDSCGRQGRESRQLAVGQTAWTKVGPDLAFRIAAAVAEVEMMAVDGPPSTGPACKVDVNGNGEVTVQDLFEFLAQFFAGCP